MGSTRIIYSENGYKLLILANALDVVHFPLFLFFTSQNFENLSCFRRQLEEGESVPVFECCLVQRKKEMEGFRTTNQAHCISTWSESLKVERKIVLVQTQFFFNCSTRFCFLFTRCCLSIFPKCFHVMYVLYINLVELRMVTRYRLEICLAVHRSIIPLLVPI